jgi:hypothetical protein
MDASEYQQLYDEDGNRREAESDEHVSLIFTWGHAWLASYHDYASGVEDHMAFRTLRDAKEWGREHFGVVKWVKESKNQWEGVIDSDR